MQWWFKKFCKVDKSLEHEEHSGWPSEVINSQLRAIRAHPLTITSEVANELNINHSMVIWHLKQIGKVKNLNKWMSHKLIKKGKKKLFWCVFFSTWQQWTIYRSCYEKWTSDTGEDQLSGWIEKHHQSTSQSQTCNKKGSWSHLVGCWQPNPLYLSESQRNHYIWEVYSAKWMPKCMSYNQCFKSWTNWATKFYLFCHIHSTSHQMTTTS